MAVFLLSEDPTFPPASMAEGNGLLAVGGDLSSQRLLAAYSGGIFPWFSEGDPLLWWSPDPRLVLEPGWLHVSGSLKKTIKRGIFSITFDQAFADVIKACACAGRPEGRGTWITRGMMDAYIRLHELGHAHSVEAWMSVDGQSRLAGGLYGVAMGGCFFGESMFYDFPDASKVAFVTLVKQLEAWGFSIIDCQMTTQHLLRFGAREISREKFLQSLEQSLRNSVFQGRWSHHPSCRLQARI
ncbi:MAG TPA: leucyl/phenylalanyl-tRNA--protein transferase [Magnetococcales bacterium]|nr:leucyl/phenylalanyl-tRNA--protein transferase [Magnetococcales bacterium]